MELVMTKEISTEVKLAYVGGGSLNWAHVLMADLIHDGTISGEIRLYDLDIAAAERNAVIGNRLSQAHGVDIRYVVSSTLQDALTGTDFVVISILPGSFDDMAHDIELPRVAGIRQAVGDTVGPGGFVRAMRAIPAMAEIAHAIQKYSPKAFVCNLTNPMSVLTGTLYAVFPEIRAWGECHEVTKLRHIIAWLANQKGKGKAVGFRDVQMNVLGINHFTFVDRATVDGEDFLPEYLAFAASHMEKGWREVPLDPANEYHRYFEDMNRVKFDLSARFGIAAAAGDRHLAEFLPMNWYLANVEDWGFGLTPVVFRNRERLEKQAAAKKVDMSGETPILQPASEEALVGQIKALTKGDVLVVNANMPNRGQMDGFAPGTIVETNVMFSGLGIQPIFAGRLPAAVEALVKPHAERQTALVRAVLEGDVEALEGLFLTDPLVRYLPPEKASSLLRSMVTATANRLPEKLRTLTN
jgi:alpha-galactosidase